MDNATSMLQQNAIMVTKLLVAGNRVNHIGNAMVSGDTDVVGAREPWRGNVWPPHVI